MKRFTYIITILVFVIATSCDDTLDQRLSSSVEVDEAIVDLNSLNLATNGAYSFLASANNYGRTVLLVPEILSDNAFINAFDNTGRYLDYDAFNLNANDGNADGTWNNFSDIIATTSIAIREANELTFPESEQEDANQYIGELHALRALAFHNFQLFFAQPYNFTADASHLGVPIPDFSLLGNGGTVQSPARNTTAEVYSQIISDLQTAIGLMRDNGPEERFDAYAARALLARVYLHMEEWELARDLATEVINDSGTELLNNSEYVASWDGLDATDETLATIDFNATDNLGSNSITHFFLEYEDAFASADFVSLFEATDVRLELYPADGSVFLVQKYPSAGFNDDNIQYLRLSETYLIKAEAHARLNENTDAQMALDAIRLRADLNAVPSTEIGGALIDKILVERRKELGFEGFRLFDLTRNGLTYNKFRQDAASELVNAPEDRTILPIPIDEMNVNPNMVQNPGY
ncbi:RagB/SusD family nutrient uptake outer membrane protein [Winogradskyella sp.]|uniref:RagB/SusD family nutrient uptake outer membrane protein n=1 Tax=Winogradskyella sp. TaxID=1883156 RepID=UPI003BAB3AB4